MDARARARGGRLPARDDSRVFAVRIGRVDVGVDARRRDGDADGVGRRHDGPWDADEGRRRDSHVRIVDDERVGGGDEDVRHDVVRGGGARGGDGG